MDLKRRLPSREMSWNATPSIMSQYEFPPNQSLHCYTKCPKVKHEFAKLLIVLIVMKKSLMPSRSIMSLHYHWSCSFDLMELSIYISVENISFCLSIAIFSEQGFLRFPFKLTLIINISCQKAYCCCVVGFGNGTIWVAKWTWHWSKRISHQFW